MKRRYRGTNRGPVRPMQRAMRLYRNQPVYTPNAIVQSAPASRSYQSSKAASRLWAPFGKSKIVTHHYTENISLNPALGTPADYVFSANGMYDPNITGTGHQPYAFDQLSAIYNEYTVSVSKCTVTAWNNQGNYPFWIAICLRDDNTSITADVNAVREAPGIVSQLLAPSSSSAVGTVTHSFDAKKFFDVKDLGDASELRAGLANPAEQAYYHVLMMPQNSTDDLGTNVLTVDIEYTAVWTGPKILSQS